MLLHKMERRDLSDDEEEECDLNENDFQDDDDDDTCFDVKLYVTEFNKKQQIPNGFWLYIDDDVDLRLARIAVLVNRRPELANRVLRKNLHNVEQWHRRVKLSEGNSTKQILTYTETVKTVDPMKAVGLNLHENHEGKGLKNAREILEEAVQRKYKTVDELASVWCAWPEVELKNKNFKKALQLLRHATEEPSFEVKRRVASSGDEPIQMKLQSSLKLWTFYLDLEESVGDLGLTREAYEKILDLRIDIWEL